MYPGLLSDLNDYLLDAAKQRIDIGILCGQSVSTFSYSPPSPRDVPLRKSIGILRAGLFLQEQYRLFFSTKPDGFSQPIMFNRVALRQHFLIPPSGETNKEILLFRITAIADQNFIYLFLYRIIAQSGPSSPFLSFRPRHRTNLITGTA